MQKDWMNLALDLARMIGMTDLAPVEDIYIDAVQAGADDGVIFPRPASGRAARERRDPGEGLAIIRSPTGAFDDPLSRTRGEGRRRRRA